MYPKVMLYIDSYYRLSDWIEPTQVVGFIFNELDSIFIDSSSCRPITIVSIGLCQSDFELEGLWFSFLHSLIKVGEFFSTYQAPFLDTRLNNKTRCKHFFFNHHWSLARWSFGNYRYDLRIYNIMTKVREMLNFILEDGVETIVNLV